MLNACTSASVSVCRAGVYPYFIDETGEIQVLVNYSTKYNQLSDFGGRVEKQETPLKTGIRELAEETDNLISEQPTVCYHSQPYIHTEDVIVFFFRYRETFIRQVFKNFLSDKHHEISRIKIISLKKMLSVPQSELWHKTYKLLKKCSENNIEHILKQNNIIN